MIEVLLSVHQLVDFLLRDGDIDNRVFNTSTMQMGSIMHRQEQTLNGDGYQSEVFLKRSFICEDFIFTLQGRADGIIVTKNGVTIDEIKTTNSDLNDFHEKNGERHLAQAKIYALIYALDNNLSIIDVKLTYLSQIGSNRLVIKEQYTVEELNVYVYELLERYLEFERIILKTKNDFYKTASRITFPYNYKRKYQTDLIDDISRAIKSEKYIMVEAPTGLGKTVSILYPTIKQQAISKNRIFYLTAKTTGQTTAIETMSHLFYAGLKARSIVLTSKEKMCFTQEQICNPDNCPFTRNYYGKLNNIIKEVLLGDLYVFNRDTVEMIARKHEVCPFELQLDLSLFFDVIIGDYNYMFDPNVSLQRYQDEGELVNQVLLIDEAHHLLERCRAMYSADLTFDMFNYFLLNNKKDKRISKLKTQVRKITKSFELYFEFSDDRDKIVEFDDEILKNISQFIVKYEDFFRKIENRDYKNQGLKTLYLNCKNFIKIYELSNPANFVYYIENTRNEMKLSILCVNPTVYMNKVMQHRVTNICFSATLLPNSYYKEMLYGKNEICKLNYMSPFDKNNMNIMVANNISLKYKDREESFTKVVELVNAFIEGKIGNYLIFAPSFEYLNKLKVVFSGKDYCHFQERNSKDYEKNELLSRLEKNPSKTNVIFTVLSGAFSESIDLKEDLLIGVCIIGVGFPTMSYEKELIKEYLANNDYDSFNYTYVYPAISTVRQSGGRLIRTENDIGSILLIDNRYSFAPFSRILTGSWSKYKVVHSAKDIEKTLNDFYEKHS